MAIDGEPKDGDYVRYVEKLINRGQAAPGQVVDKTRGALPAPAMPPSPGEVVRETAPATGTPGLSWGRGSKPAAPAATPPQRNAQAGTTLAAKAAKRRGALGVTIVALAIAWQAIRMLFEAFRQPGFDPHDLVPVAFLLVFAGMLWRAARSRRTRANEPAPRLPPLTTISQPGRTKSGS